MTLTAHTLLLQKRGLCEQRQHQIHGHIYRYPSALCYFPASTICTIHTKWLAFSSNTTTLCTKKCECILCSMYIIVGVIPGHYQEHSRFSCNAAAISHIIHHNSIHTPLQSTQTHINVLSHFVLKLLCFQPGWGILLPYLASYNNCCLEYGFSPFSAIT